MKFLKQIFYIFIACITVCIQAADSTLTFANHTDEAINCDVSDQANRSLGYSYRVKPKETIQKRFNIINGNAYTVKCWTANNARRGQATAPLYDTSTLNISKDNDNALIINPNLNFLSNVEE